MKRLSTRPPVWFVITDSATKTFSPRLFQKVGKLLISTNYRKKNTATEVDDSYIIGKSGF